MDPTPQPPTNPYAAPQSTSPPPVPAGAGQFAPCPRCGGTLATRVGFTWWGGLLGPKLLHHVKCAGCRTKYNGQTGHYNTLGIVIYLGVGALLGIGIIMAWMLVRMAH
jgi:hypothetical protein